MSELLLATPGRGASSPALKSTNLQVPCVRVSICQSCGSSAIRLLAGLWSRLVCLTGMPAGQTCSVWSCYPAQPCLNSASTLSLPCCTLCPMPEWALLCWQPLERSQSLGKEAPPSPIMHRLARVSTVAEEGEDGNRRQQSVPASAFQSAKAQRVEQVCG